MKNVLLILAILATTVTATLEASARMGETIAQCDQRYGVQKQSPGDNLFTLLSGPGVTNRTYRYQGWIIRNAFIRGRTAIIRYSKANSQKIENDEMQAILKAESHGGTWTEKSQISLNPVKHLQNAFTKPRLWTNSNGATAYFDNPQYLSMTIEAPVVEQYKKAMADAAERQRKSSIPEF